MPQYDGSIRINTKIEAEDAAKKLKQLLDLKQQLIDLGANQNDSYIQNYDAEIKKLKDSLDDFRKTNEKAWNELQQESEKAEEPINGLLDAVRGYKKELDSLEKAGKFFGDAEYDEIYSYWKDATDEVRAYKAELNKQTNSGMATEAEAAARAEEKRLAAQQRAEEQAEKARQREEARAQKEAEAAARRQAQLEEEQRIIAAQEAEEQRLAQIKENATVSDQKIIEALERRRQLVEEIADMERAGVGAGYAEYDAARLEIEAIDQQVREYNSNIGETKAAYQKLASVAKSALSVIAKGTQVAIAGTKKLAFMAKSVFLGFSRSSRGAASSNNAFAASFKNILKYGLGIRSVYALFNKLRTAIKEGFSNLSSESVGLKNSIDGLKASLLTLKNAFAAAFAPIVQIAIPYIQTLVNWLTKALDSIGQLIAALTGQKYYTKAVKQTAAAVSDQADATKKSAKASKDAAKEQKKQLSSLDKLNNQSSENEDSADKSSGGGGSAAGGGAGGMFTQAPISDKWKNIADWLKEMWEKADFTELGTLLGTKLKEALDNIPWEKIKKTAQKVGKSLATLLNGFVEVPGLATSIGRTIGEAINTGVTGINAFLDNTHWDSVGKFIGEGLNGVVNTIDWEALGHMFAQKWNAFFETINNVAETFDWEALGSSLSDSVNKFIKDINLDEVGNAIANTLNGLSSMIGKLAEKIKWNEVGKKIGNGLSFAIKKFRWSEAGGNIGEFVSGLLECLKSIIDATDWGSLGKGITSAISSFLGNINWGTVGGTISSFAIGIFNFLTGLFQGVDWGQLAQNIINGIFQFFSGFDYAGIFGSLGELTGTAIASGIDLLASLGEVLATAWDGVVSYFSGYIEDSGGNIIKGLWKGITDALAKVGSWIKKNIFDPFIKGFKKAFGINSPSKEMKKQGNMIVSGLKAGITEKWGEFVNFWQEKKDAIIQKFKDIKDKFLSKGREIINGIRAGITEKWDTFISFWQGKKDAIINKFNDIKGKFLAKGKEIIDGIKEGIKDKWDTFIDFWQKKKDAIVNKFEKIKDDFLKKGKEIIDGIKEGIKDKWDGFATFWQDKKNAIVNKFEKIKDDFLAKGKDIIAGIEDGIGEKWDAFSTFWEGKKNAILNTFSKIKTDMKGVGQNIVNGIIEGVNSLWKKITDIVGEIKKAFTIKVDTSTSGTTATTGPTTSPRSLSTYAAAANLSTTPIPAYATGQVIPRTMKQHLAILGDNNRETEIVSPLSTMEQAVENVLKRNGIAAGTSTSGDIVIQIDGREIFRVTQKQAREYFRKTGSPAFD